MNNYLLFFQFLLLFLIPNSLASSDSFLQCLSTSKIPKTQLSNITYTPNNKDYTSILQRSIRNSRFNTSSTLKPTIILTPWQESQVQDIVTCAKQTGLQLRTRSGGHDYEGLSYTSKTPFIILDMFNLRSVDINLNDETVWVQSGATLGELYYKIWEKSKVHAFPSGVCPTIGVGGHISGGGYGNLLRKYGLSVDNLLDAKIVDSKGRILDRQSMGEDLFWAIRGGGGASFGVILSYKIRLVEVPPVVTVFQVPKTLEENAAEILHHWQNFAPMAARELFIRVFLQPTKMKNNAGPTVTASFIGLYLGDSRKLVSIMDEFFPELGLKTEDCKEMTWIKSVLFWANFHEGTPETALLDRKQSSSFFKFKSDYVKTQISVAGLTEILEKTAKSENIWMQFNPYGGRMSEIPDSETAFPHRAGIVFKIQYLLIWNEPGPVEETKNLQKLRDFYNFMTPYVSKNPREAFLNYRDIDIGSMNSSKNGYDEAKVYGVKYFKGNFDRLVKVKTIVDPDNFFRNEQSIPTLTK